MYSQSITRTHRTAFVVLVDGSGSMGEEILFRGIRISKAKAVSMIANELLFELIERVDCSILCRLRDVQHSWGYHMLVGLVGIELCDEALHIRGLDLAIVVG